MEVTEHSIYRLLKDLGLIDPNCIELYAERVRDRSDISVYRCSKSGVVFLSKIDQAEISYYVDKDVNSRTLTCEDRKIPFVHVDNARRQANEFGHLVDGKRWLDFGCGSGALLEVLGERAEEAWGVEPNYSHIESADDRNVRIVQGLDDLPSGQFDVITLFHVFEHLSDPISMAKKFKSLLKEGGIMLIEVPHARDFLLETLDCKAFRRFTLWSEHLILHTRESLTKFLLAAGFDQVDVTGYQRFSLSNHLYWLRHGKPGGHEEWAFLDTPEVTSSYSKSLVKQDQTDTIVALAKV